MHRMFYLLLLATMFSACLCTKKYCVEFDSVFVSFYGFDPSEIDTIYSTGYARDGNFTQVTREKQRDTVGTNNLFVLDSAISFESKTNQRLQDTYDWELYIPATGKTYRISHYSYNTSSCNCPQDKYTSLTGCRVNGKDSPREIKIYK